MAEAFTLFAKTFARSFGIAAWRVAASYDQDIIRVDEQGINVDNSKKAAGRRYSHNPSKLGAGMQKSFSVRPYATLADLVSDRTRSSSEVAHAIERDALRTDEELRRVDEVTTGWGDATPLSPWEVSGLHFCFESKFRSEFDQALYNDGFRGNAQLLWSGIDRVAESLGEDDEEVHPIANPSQWQIEELGRCEQEIVASMVLASLLGPKDYSQNMGHEAEATLMAGASPSKERCEPSRTAFLRPVIPVGLEPWDYVFDDVAPFCINAGETARIGRVEKEPDRTGNLAFVAPSPCVSKEHCELTWQDESSLKIRDLGSLNGTLVINPSGRRALLFDEQTVLKHGSIICLAPCKTDSEYREDSYSWELRVSGTCYRLEIV